MDLSERTGKNPDGKLLPFRAPALRGLSGALDLDQVPHDIGTLRRPVAAESARLPQVKEADSLAHDARNLLTSLMLVSDMLGEPGILAEPFKHYARDLKLLTGTLTTLVERMAKPPQLGADPVFVREALRPPLPSNVARTAEWSRKPTDAQAEAAGDAGLMVKSCERLLAAVAGPRVSLQISFERSIGRLTLHGDELTRVLLNLVKNASEAMPSGGRVAITVRRALGPGPAALISVQDSGTGIPAHAMGQIFQAGFTSKPAERKWPAMAHHGLGLTIVRDLVEGAGGSVRVMSALKKGTTFELRVPCRRES